MLLIAAIGIVLAAPAQAKSVDFPQKLVGDWCEKEGHQDKSNYTMGTCTEDHKSFCMKLTKDTYKVSDGRGSLVSGRMEKVTRTGFTFVAKMRCEHDGKFDQQIDFNFDGLHLEVRWFNKNFGKADDYGSERFAVINQCMIDKAKSMDACMAKSGYVFCRDCQIFGNEGPRCKDDDPLHSWCWEQDVKRYMKR